MVREAAGRLGSQKDGGILKAAWELPSWPPSGNQSHTPIAAFTRSCESGKSRSLTPAAFRSALVIAAAVGPCPALPVPKPKNGSPGGNVD